MSAPSVLELDMIGKRYGDKTALDGIDLAIAPGECLALLGHNGAGKTTLIKIMLGLTRPSSGRVRIGGDRVLDVRGRQWRSRLGFLPENVAFDGSMSGREMLRFYGSLKGRPQAECDALLARVGLGGDGERRIRTYSKGMRQRLGLAQALLGTPSLLLLDEPTTGLDPVSRRQFYELIGERVSAGATVVISSHSLNEIESQARRFALLQHGQLLASGTLGELREQAGIPIQIRLRVNAGAAPRVAEQIQPPARCKKINDQFIDLSCAAGDKMRLLQEVSLLGHAVQDVEIRPPNLEDIYVCLTRGHQMPRDPDMTAGG